MYRLARPCVIRTPFHPFFVHYALDTIYHQALLKVPKCT